jgi:hypothetical protein
MGEYHSKGLIDLRKLVTGSVPDRILYFHEEFPRMHLKDAELAILCQVGVWKDGQFVPQPKQVTKARGRLVDQGLLLKSLSGWKDKYGNALYDYTPNYSLDAQQEGLARYAFHHLSEKIGRKTLKGNPVRLVLPQDKAMFLATDWLDEQMPEVYWLAGMGPLDRLVDFTNPDVMEFWTAKLHHTLNAKGHPLKKYLEESWDFQAQLAVAVLHEGVQRNKAKNPHWKGPDNPVGWALSALKERTAVNLGGSTSDEWNVEVDEMRTFVKKQEKAGCQTICDTAKETLAALQGPYRESMKAAERMLNGQVLSDEVLAEVLGGLDDGEYNEEDGDE